jgi:phosphoribosylglycinamide formyltransferase
MAQPKYNITVLISGSGTNLQALIDACGTPSLPDTKITHVISKYFPLSPPPIPH